MWKLDIFVLLGLLVFFPTSDCRNHQIDCTVNGTQQKFATVCPETCEFNGFGGCIKLGGGPCVCKPGYIIDQRIPACVLRSDCPKDVVQKPGTIRVSNFKCFGANRCR